MTLRPGAFTTAACLLALGGVLCAQRAPSPVPNGPVVAVPASPEPAAWERRIGDRYENRGLARVERLGQLWMLTILCSGVHSTYLEPSQIDPAPFEKGYVAAQYRYVDRENKDVQCIQPPCAPVTERRIALERLTRIEATALQVQNATTTCSSAP